MTNQQNNSKNNNLSGYSSSNTDFFKEYNEPINTNYGTNGRVFFDPSQKVPAYDLYKNSNNEQKSYDNSLTYTLESSPLSRSYFDKANVDNIQQDIRQTVYQITNDDTDPILTNHKPVVLGRQNDLQLQIIMRSIYLQYAKHLPNNIEQQIRDLNDLVVKEAVPDIITNVKQYLGYSANIQRLPQPISMAQNTYKQKGEGKSFLLVS